MFNPRDVRPMRGLYPMAACPSWPNPVFAPCSYNARVQSCFARNEKAAWQEAVWVCKVWTPTPRGTPSPAVLGPRMRVLPARHICCADRSAVQPRKRCAPAPCGDSCISWTAPTDPMFLPARHICCADMSAVQPRKRCAPAPCGASCISWTAPTDPGLRGFPGCWCPG